VYVNIIEETGELFGRITVLQVTR